MEQKFLALFETARREDVTVNVKVVGDRPCGNVAQEKMDAMRAAVVPVIESVIGKALSFHASSAETTSDSGGTYSTLWALDGDFETRCKIMQGEGNHC